MLWVSPISGGAVFAFDTAETPCDETLTLVPGLGVDSTGEIDGKPTDDTLVAPKLGSDVLTTPTGINATSPLPTPSRPPTPVPSPPTTFPSVSVAPLSVHCRILLSYVAPAHPGVPAHELRHSARLGRTYTLRFVCRMFVLQRTW